MKLAVALLFVLLATSCRTPGTLPEASVVKEAGNGSFQVCTGSLPFEFDFAARELSLPNAFWLSALSSHAYATKPLVLEELKRLGLENAFFFDEDGVTRNFLRTGLNFRWASTQGFWAERPEGIILAFRGTIPTEIGDLVSDLMATQSALMAVGAETIGTIADTAAAAAGDLAGGQISGPELTNVSIHKGFWYALDIVWKHIETRARAVYAVERPKEVVLKQKRLDELAKKLAEIGEAGMKSELAAEKDWNIEVAGKLKLLKVWATVATNPQKKNELFEVIDRSWANWQRPFFVTGHSLGAALATLASYRLMKLGLNVRGLYTYGSPRVGNAGFVHDFRVLAYQKGLKAKGVSGKTSDGGINRFVNHFDVVARVPPVLGLSSVVDPSTLNPFLDKWKHNGKMRYLGDEELWVEGNQDDDEKVKNANVPLYTVAMPVEKWKAWVDDHMIWNYAGKLEKLAYGTQTPCE